ncbi:MAG: hypothetical protein WBP26_02445 [Candidatus Saccharimonadales bacterium]
MAAVASLNDLDPRVWALYGNKDRAGRTIAAFQTLRLGEPVIGLYDNNRPGRGKVTGTITGDPVNLVIHTREVSRDAVVSQPIMAPWMTFDVPLRTLDKDGASEEIMLQTELSTLLNRDIIIGRAALEKLLANVEFNVSYDNTQMCHGSGELNNGINLSILKDDIDILQQLGITKLHTRQLDKALKSATQYARSRRALAYRRPVRRRW